MPAYRAVVVGAGGISGAWFPRLLSEKVDVVGVVDLDIGQAKARIARHDIECEVSTDLADILKRQQPDFVVDLTVPEAHCQVTCTALRAGCHVIGEKPMANSMAEARRMLKASESSGKLYMVSQSRRYDKTHIALKQSIARQRIGVLSTLNCDFFVGCHFGGFRDEMDSPLILDMSIHHFDMARMVSGADPVAVYAHEFNPAGSWYKGDVAASCIFEMSNGLVFTYRGSWCAEGMHTSWHGDWRMIGDKGTIIYAGDQVPSGQKVASKSGFTRKLSDFEVKPRPLKYGGQHGALRELLRYLKDGTLPQGECHDNIKSLAMIFGAIESSKKGRRVLIKD